VTAVGQMQHTPGRHVTRQLERPLMLHSARRKPGTLATALADTHNEAVRRFGSDCGGWHVFNPATRTSEGVWDGDFPRDTVVTPLAWGRIDARTAQRVLEGDGIDTTETKD
jgi:hypothetical protein